MIPRYVITRIFQLKYDDVTGTCFIIEINNRQYICTAKHCLLSFNGGLIEIYHDNQWKSLDVSMVGHGSYGTDISVLAPSTHLCGASQLVSADESGIRYGQDVFFLGFPYNMRMDGKDLNRQFPIPFVKKATISAFTSSDVSETVLFLDGHNNPGFSGGPVVSSPREGHQDGWRIAGIVSGHGSNPIPVTSKDGEETGDLIYANTGLRKFANCSGLFPQFCCFLS
ncbi:MAG: serine protease [Bacteroidetes bacterium]|nr:serine protease [Bacteroidota bacterium]